MTPDERMSMKWLKSCDAVDHSQILKALQMHNYTFSRRMELAFL